MRILFYLPAVCLFISCQNQPPESRSEKIAGGICECSIALMELNKEAAEGKGAINFEGIQAAFSKAKSCIDKQRMKPEDWPEVEKALAIKCPELAAEAELLEELIR